LSSTIDERWLAPNEHWKAYADRTRGPDFAYWANEHCRQSVDRFAGRPLELEGWQRDIMSEALAELDEDEAYWRTTMLVIPKANGKTSMLAAYALYELVENDGAPEILLCAATDAQAGRLFDSAVRYVKSNSWLSARLVIREHVGLIARADGSFGTLRRLSGDSGAAAGYSPSLVVCDELADWGTGRRQRTWAQIASAGQVKRGSARVFVISTAGEPHERIDGALGRLIDANEHNGQLERVHRALTVSRDHDSKTLVYNYCADTEDPHDIDAIRAANPASWVSTRDLTVLSRSATLTSGQFLQLHGCVWASSAGPFVSLAEWRAAQVDDRLKPQEEITIGFRGGGGWALVACRRSDGVLFVLGTGEPGIEHERDQAERTLQAALVSYRASAMFAAATDGWWSKVDGWRLELGRKRVVEHRVDLHGPRTAELIDRFAADLANGDIKHVGDVRLSASVLAARITVDNRGNHYLTDDLEHRVPTTAALAAVLAWEAAMTTAPDDTPRGLVGEVSDYRIVPLY
jgi:hypothetical protein